MAEKRGLTIEYFDEKFKDLPKGKEALLALNKEWTEFYSNEATNQIAKDYARENWGLVESFDMSLLYCE